MSCEIKGISAVRNMALSKATGEWIASVDSDDYVELDYVSTMLSVALENEADLIQCSRTIQTGSNVIGKMDILVPFVYENRRDIHKFYLSRGRHLNQTWGKLYRRSAFEGVAYPEGSIYEDICVLPHIIENVSRMVTIDKALYHYCPGKESLTMSTGEKSTEKRTAKEKIEIKGNVGNGMNRDGFRFRLINCEFYKKRYPELLTLSYVSALDSGFHYLGKIWKTNNREEFRNTTALIKKCIKQCRGELKGGLKVGCIFFGLSPRAAALMSYGYSKGSNAMARGTRL